MLHDVQGQMSIRIARNWEQRSINPNDFAISRTVIQRVMDTCQPVLTTNAQEDRDSAVMIHRNPQSACHPVRPPEN